MEWISVNDRLPENGQRVIAANYDPILTKKHDIQTAMYRGGEWLDTWNHEDIEYLPGSVTHWMPLPPPPTVTK